MEHSKILNQRLPNSTQQPPCAEAIRIDKFVPPSRFHRKKNITGPIVSHFNKNFKTMPKEF